MSASDKPKPIITGDSQAQGIAKFASRVTYEDLTPEQQERLKVSVLILWRAPSTPKECPRSWRVWNRQNSSAVRTLDAL